MPPDPDRQLMIKAKACQRLAKEAAYYRKETEENEATLVKMRADATKDTYDVKRFEQVLSESQMMIPHSHASLQRNLRELQEMVAAHDGGNSFGWGGSETGHGRTGEGDGPKRGGGWGGDERGRSQGRRSLLASSSK